jgi:ribosomal protein S21
MLRKQSPKNAFLTTVPKSEHFSKPSEKKSLCKFKKDPSQEKKIAIKLWLVD